MASSLHECQCAGVVAVVHAALARNAASVDFESQTAICAKRSLEVGASRVFVSAVRYPLALFAEALTRVNAVAMYVASVAERPIAATGQ